MFEPPNPVEEIDVERAEEGQQHQENYHGSLLTATHNRSSIHHTAQYFRLGTHLWLSFNASQSQTHSDALNRIRIRTDP
jgi:hypothetical protein